MKFSDVEIAFEMASSSLSLPYVIIHKQTAQMLCDHDELDEYEIETARDQGVDVDGPDWVALPNKQDLDLGTKLVMDFAADHLSDKDFDRVQGIFSRSGAYRRFKDLLEDRDKSKAWYDYKAARKEKALREWCADNEIPLEG